MGDHEDLERRVNLAAQVARLEERSVNTQDQLARIERLLSQQSVSMEKMMGEFTQKIDGLEEKISPMKDQINYWRGAIWIIAAVLAVAIGIVTKVLLGA